METSLATYWFVIVTLMLAVYVVLDGFDFGTGIIYLFAARSDVERRTVLRAIGPVWNGNEVWLIAGGGLLFFAFPKVYAAGFSGFYLALIIVLWLLMFRGLSIELRSHVDHPLWRAFWDASFAVASLLLAIVFGAALGNLLRGVPLNPEGYFFTALWTTFTPGPEPGILDWYTILMGVLGALILTGHGANYLAMKTGGDLYQRACRIAHVSGWLVAGLSVLAILATMFVQPALRRSYDAHPVGYALPLLGALALAAMLNFRRRERNVAAFMASSAFIVGMLGGAAWGLFPNLLLATKDPAHSLTVYNAAAPGGLGIGLVWFAVGISLVIAYTVYVYRSFWGKVELSSLEGGGNNGSGRIEGCVEVRKQLRFVVHLPGSFLGEHRTGDGVLLNLSTGGCAIRSDARLQPGSFVELQIDLPDLEPPVGVEVALVRWSRGDEFGLDFISLRPEEDRRLSRFLRSPRWWRRVKGFVRRVRTRGRRDGEG